MYDAGGKKRDDDHSDFGIRENFDPFSGSAGIDRDFDNIRLDELEIVERLRDRGSL